MLRPFFSFERLKFGKISYLSLKCCAKIAASKVKPCYCSLWLNKLVVE